MAIELVEFEGEEGAQRIRAARKLSRERQAHVKTLGASTAEGFYIDEDNTPRSVERA